MAQKILGLDLGAQSIKAVLVEGSMRSWEVLGQARVRLDSEPAPAAATNEVPPAEGAPQAPPSEETEPTGDPLLTRALASLREQLGDLHADVVAISLPGLTGSSPLVQLPFNEPKKIEATLGFEVEGLLPFDIDEAVYDYQILSQGEDGSELLVGVVRQEIVATLLAELRIAGIDPRVITLAGLAIQPLLADLATRSLLGAEEELAFLDLGFARSTLTVAQGSANEKLPPSLVFTRTFVGGGAELERAHEQAPEIRMDALPLPPALQRPLQTLVREIRQSLRAAQSRTRRPISELVIAGEIALIPGLVEFLGRELGLPTRLVALQGPAAAIPVAEQPLYAQALGLALRGMMRGGPKLLNFRKGPFAYKGDLDYLKGKVSRLAVFAAALVLLLGGNVWAQMRTVSAEEQQLDDALCAITQKVLGKCETDYNVALSILQGGGTQASMIPTASAIEVFTAAVAQVPEEAGLRFEEVDVTLERMRLRGTVDSFDGVDQVVAGLNKSRCIGEVKRGRVQRNKDERIEFVLDALYVCGQNAEQVGGEGQEG